MVKAREFFNHQFIQLSHTGVVYSFCIFWRQKTQTKKPPSKVDLTQKPNFKTLKTI